MRDRNAAAEEGGRGGLNTRVLAKFQIGNSIPRSIEIDGREVKKRFESNGIRPSGLPIEIRRGVYQAGEGEGEEAAIDN